MSKIDNMVRERLNQIEAAVNFKEEFKVKAIVQSFHRIDFNVFSWCVLFFFPYVGKDIYAPLSTLFSTF